MTVLKRVVVPAVIVLLLVAAAFTMFRGNDTKTLTAHFPRTISIYEGSDVRVLGVPVGHVDTVTPSGTDVVVTMSYDANVKALERRIAALLKLDADPSDDQPPGDGADLAASGVFEQVQLTRSRRR